MAQESLHLLKKTLRANHVDFDNDSLLHQALTHRSYINEHGMNMNDSNERLEFLGDSVLGLVINDYLYHEYPDYTEGQLAKLKSQLVSESALAEKANAIELGRFVYLSRGEDMSGGRNRESLLADTMEALIGAIFLHKGLSGAREFVLHYFLPVEELARGHPYREDYKSALQEFVQQLFNKVPEYEIVDSQGPEHHKSFTARVIINGQEFGRGTDLTKKKAEQKAAYEALNRKQEWQQSMTEH